MAEIIESEHICLTCGEIKPRSDFSIRRESPNGILRKACKVCRSKKQQIYSKTPEGREVQHKADKIRHQRFPQRRAARSALYHALQQGIVIPLPCEICGDMQSEAHHPDYSKPFEVQWLCYNHHKQIHQPGVSYVR